MRLFLDTNVLVSAASTRGLCADLFHLALAEHQLLLGETVLVEFERVAARQLRLPAPLVKDWVALFREQAEVVTAGAAKRIETRDPSDDVVLAEAIAGMADLLVTGDRDLLAVAAKAPVAIVTPRACWEQLRRDGAPT